MNFARDHGLRFNAAKTQLIRFSKLPSPTYNEVFHFCGTNLKFSKEVTHLGHILSDDSADIIRETRHLLRKANYTLCTFSFADPFVLCSLIKSDGEIRVNLCRNLENSVEIMHAWEIRNLFLKIQIT